jgi:molybdopterin-guanine dinucleotide biosynthesis protein A
VSLPFGVIIAGGGGQRLGGVRKGELRVGGVRLVDRVAQALGPVAAPLLIATGPHRAPPNLPGGALAIADLPYPVGGPLAGLAAAMLALRARGIERGVLVSAPVDSPFLPAGFAATMMQALGAQAAVYARHADDFYPPAAAWRLEAIGEVAGAIAEGSAPPSLRALHERLGSQAVEWPAGAPNPFTNINTIADLMAAERRKKGLCPLQSCGTFA